MKSSPRILIIRLSALGDILHALPAFSDLRTAFPDAAIDWLAAWKSSFLLKAIPGIDTLHVLDTDSLLRFPPDRSAWRALRSLIRALRNRNYDFAIDFQGLLKTAILGSLTGARTRIGFSKELVRERPAHRFYHRVLEKPSKQVHVLVQNQMLAGLIGSRPTAVAAVDFSIPAEDGCYVESLLAGAGLDDFVVLNPGGGWPTKRWSPERYGKLAKRIREELGVPVVVTTGPGEESLFRTIAEFSGSPSPVHMPVSFLQLVPLLKKARLLVGGDTGPFHLACALGTPVVGIFGPTSVVRNGAWRETDEVVSHVLECGPCYGRLCSKKNECMDIRVDEVFAGVARRVNIRSAPNAHH
jgi:heptosyltransferase I